MSLKNQCIFVVFSFQIAFKLVEAMFFERQYAQKWRLGQAFRDSYFFFGWQTARRLSAKKTSK
jgi:hypothetical protein